MQTVSALLGAAGIAVIGGVALGASVPTNPITKNQDLLAGIPKHEIASLTPEEVARRTPKQDQFPLETADGVIPVHELALHGRLMNRMREQPLYGARSYDEAYGLAAYAETGIGGPADAVDYGAHEVAAIAHPSGHGNTGANFVPLEPGIFEYSSANPAGPANVRVTSGYSGEG